MLSQLIIKQVWGEHSFNKSQLGAYLSHVRKPALVAPNPLRRKADSGRTKPAPAESQLLSHQAHSGGKPTPVAPPDSTSL